MGHKACNKCFHQPDTKGSHLREPVPNTYSAILKLKIFSIEMTSHERDKPDKGGQIVVHNLGKRYIVIVIVLLNRMHI